MPSSILRRSFILVLLVLSIATAQSASAAVIGPGLATQLASASPSDKLPVIVTFNRSEAINPSDITLLRALGITQGITLRSLPVAGILATPGQIQALAQNNSVLSLYPNKQLEYFNEAERQITGVDRARIEPRFRTSNGMPFSGKGVTVVVNDGGIDALHPDLQYGTHVIQNVQGATNLHAVVDLLPITYVENQPITDTFGHGTHVAGTVGGTGQQSGGVQAGVAPGANLVGYGSGAAIFVLDAIGGLDYALTHQFQYGIRVVNNSWGTSGPFDPLDPVNLASYRLYQRGMVVLFAAGNEGPGEDTHNPYAVAPWVISVGAGDNQGRIADFSSRGKRGDTGTFTMPDGTSWTYVNQPAIVGPGVDVVSTKASTDALGVGGDDNPFYTINSGTSMATPHVSGIVALMLEANPGLTPDQVKSILQQTATNMPGHESWEVGSGYVNAYAAIARTLGLRNDYGTTLNGSRTFNANVVLAGTETSSFSLMFMPVADNPRHTFQIGSDVAMVTARAEVPANTVALVLTDPDGVRYGSSITLPQLGEVAIASAPGKAGTWTLHVSGIGSVSGVAVDPLGVTNGVALPGNVSGTLSFLRIAGYTGLNDITSHPYAGAIKVAVGDRLVDGDRSNAFRPDAKITRAELADYLVSGTGVRQSLPLSGSNTFADATGALGPFAEAVIARGAALRDRAQINDGVMRPVGTSFKPSNYVSRAELAYSLVQALGLQSAARSYTGPIQVFYDNRYIPIDDAGQIPADLRGYVQVALDLNLMNAYFRIEQGPLDLTPTIRATFKPSQQVTRAEYAVTATRFFKGYLSDIVE
jgi:serine protease AprX